MKEKEENDERSEGRRDSQSVENKERYSDRNDEGKRTKGEEEVKANENK